MNGRPRSTSLYCRLGSSVRRKLVLEWLFEKGMGYTEIAKRIVEDFGVKTSSDGVTRFAERSKGEWVTERAKERATAKYGALPENLDEEKKRALAQHEFTFATGELTFTQTMAFQRLELDRERWKLQQELDPQRHELAKRKVELLERKLSQADKTTEDIKLTPEEKQVRIREILGMT